MHICMIQKFRSHGSWDTREHDYWLCITFENQNFLGCILAWVSFNLLDTGFVLAVLPYEGKKTKLVDHVSRKDIGFSGTAAYTLLQPYLGLHHVVVMDSWFTSPALAYSLLDKNTYLLGTVAKKRKNMPPMKTKLKKGDVKVFTDGKLMIEP